MEIVPLAFDSLGARGMSTWVSTKDLSIVIDPGVNLGPKRYGLPPHPIEVKKKAALWEEIKEYSSKADCLVITHYHQDHYNPDELEIFTGKLVLVRHPTEKINYNQRVRAQRLLASIERRVHRLEYSDGRHFQFGGTRVRFSGPVPHGSDTRRGWVTEVSISDGSQRFLHTSDVDGAALDEHLEFIRGESPQTLIVDGPTLLGRSWSPNGLARIIEEIDVKRVVVDHHPTRYFGWEENLRDAYEVAKEKGVRLETAAEFKGVPNEFLEMNRKALYGT